MGTKGSEIYLRISGRLDSPSVENILTGKDVADADNDLRVAIKRSARILN